MEGEEGGGRGGRGLVEGVISYSGPLWPHKLGDDKGGRRAELPREV